VTNVYLLFTTTLPSKSLILKQWNIGYLLYRIKVPVKMMQMAVNSLVV